MLRGTRRLTRGALHRCRARGVSGLAPLLALALLVIPAHAAEPDAAEPTAQTDPVQLAAKTDPAQPAGLALETALREALRLNPNISLQREQVFANRGFEMQALGRFDPLISGSVRRDRDLRPLRADETNALAPLALADPPIGIPEAQISNTMGYTVGVDRNLQSGPTVGVSVESTTLFDNLSGFSRIPAQTAGRISFTLRVPLLRNAGTEATTANLSAAQAEVAAAQYDLVFTNSQTLLNTALAYWDYLAQLRRLDIAREAEGRSLRLSEETRRLIAADEVPAADIQLVDASASERLANRIAAEQAVAEARRVLANQIGLPPERLAVMPPPADDFPAYRGEPLALDTRIADLLNLAYSRRADLEAARHRERAARRRLDLARSGLKPLVDLTVRVGYNTLVESRATFQSSALEQHRVGPSINATLAMQLPWRNTAAEGVFLTQSSALNASIIRFRSLADVIGNSVLTDSQGLLRSAQQVVQTGETTRLYRTTVANEQTRRRLGLATLIDMINVEDRLTNALIAEIQARQAYANAIAQLRFDLGTIVQERDGQFDVIVRDLLVPAFEGPR